MQYSKAAQLDPKKRPPETEQNIKKAAILKMRAKKGKKK